METKMTPACSSPEMPNSTRMDGIVRTSKVTSVLRSSVAARRIMSSGRLMNRPDCQRWMLSISSLRREGTNNLGELRREVFVEQKLHPASIASFSREGSVAAQGIGVGPRVIGAVVIGDLVGMGLGVGPGRFDFPERPRIVFGHFSQITSIIAHGPGEEMDRDTRLGNEGDPAIRRIAKLDRAKPLPAARFPRECAPQPIRRCPILRVRRSSHSPGVLRDANADCGGFWHVYLLSAIM